MMIRVAATHLAAAQQLVATQDRALVPAAAQAPEENRRAVAASLEPAAARMNIAILASIAAKAINSANAKQSLNSVPVSSIQCVGVMVKITATPAKLLLLESALPRKAAALIPLLLKVHPVVVSSGALALAGSFAKQRSVPVMSLTTLAPVPTFQQLALSSSFRFAAAMVRSTAMPAMLAVRA